MTQRAASAPSGTATRRVDQVDDFFGTSVPDPYRWLENGDDPEVQYWLRAQAAHTRSYLDALPGRAAITAVLDSAVRVPRSGLPVHRGASWFRTANDGTQQQSVLLVSSTPFGEARTLIDPTPLSADATTSLAVSVPSPNGALLAYSFSEAGSDWLTWHVREVASGDDLPDVLEWAKFTGAEWLADGSGFVYGRFDAPSGDEYVSANAAQRLELHRVGTPQSADELVLALPEEPDITFWPEITEDGRWLVVLGTRGTEPRGRVWVRDLGDPDGQMRMLVAESDASWELVGSGGTELLMITDREAPLHRLLALDAVDGSAREVIAARDDRLESAVVAGGRLVVAWLHDASSRATVHDLDGVQLDVVPMPALGSVTGLEARSDEAVVYLDWTTFTDPPAVLAYNVDSGELSTAFAPSTASDHRSEQVADLGTEVVTEQVWATSRDGTRLPVFLLHRPDVTVDNGPHPAWLYGYGGFRIPMTPTFEPTRFAFAAAGGVVAVACLRGGGEYGAWWHDAGRRAYKQNTFDDAIAAASHLVDTGWTSSSRLALSGRSNGGLMAGAVLTQRPDLFAAVVPEVGVLDMLRFPLWTIGWAWISDYGDPRADAAQFRTLLAYSPLHNLRPNAGYPPVLVLTSDHDDRVVPAHSMKFLAQLQAVSPPEGVALLRVEMSGGHKEGRSHDALIAERRDVLAFLAAATGLSFG